ncbi:DUF2264 domain-containing protein [Catenuloplanes atrovinosus]|uniref:DUF2264 domain-containing protein n=1 Tax=Catenuloplanes atrovinosus TaxID=137266 RepID=A0AAE3YM86_9ACTN|nr:DUF2264 domain-containing protein [Catenuloplanes atrovinosus]MDR7274431.1 hypothetical protein [Catenuloplanes atrovinosus]
MELPSEDRIRSPHTGWTRAHWEAMADHLLEAVVPYAVPGFAQIRLPGRTSRAGATSDGLEGFARTFLLAGMRISGDRGETPRAKILIERYAEGLATGTDPRHRYAWPPIEDYSQPIVEAASVALMLAETRPWLWDRLDAGVRRSVHRWLEGIVGTRPWPCNWLLFQVVVEQFLADTGGRHDPAEITGGLDAIEGWYRGGGWYSDGAGQHYDHYAGWAMHLYPLLWARMPGAAGSDRVARYRERLHAFLDDFRLMFARDGAPMHQGRSLTYRYAAAAALWTGALADATPLPPGETRRLASGALRYFADRGAPDEAGLLRLGYHGQFPPITQPYSGPASPYWAAKGFLGLLLPAGHPVWTATEEPAAVERGDVDRALPAPGWLLRGTRADGVVRLYNHGSDHIKVPAELGDDPERDDPHYAKLAYSTHTAPETETRAWERNTDGHTGLEPPGGGPVTRRRRIHRIGVADRFAASRYVDGEVTVETASVLCGAASELRIDRITAPAGWVPRTGGFAVAGASTPAARAHDRTAEVVGPAGLTSRIVGLHGWSSAGVQRMSGANAFGTRSATPYLTGAPHPGGTAVYVALVTLAGPVTDVAPAVSADRDEVVAVLPDGEEIRVRLGAAPRYSRRPPPGGGPSITWDPTVP